MLFKHYLSPITEKLKNADELTKIAIINALGEIGDAKVIFPLLRSAVTLDSFIRTASLRSIRDIVMKKKT